MDDELISVIIPVYNAEKYIRKCIESVLNQTYRNLEIILIDDGSTDNSYSVCQEYNNNSSVKIIHKENEGVSKARNYGIDISNGKYLIFIDADDYISCDMIEKLYKNIKENNADISMCNIIRINEKGQYIDKFNKNIDKKEKKVEILSRDEFISNILDYRCYFTYATNKLIKKEVLKKVRFNEEIHYNEDGVFFLELSNNIKKAVYIEPVELYFYLQNSNSANAQKFNERSITIIKSFEIFETYFNEFNYKNKCYFAYRYVSYFLEYYYYLLSKNNSVGKEELKKVIKKYFKYAIKADDISIIKKNNLILKVLFPKLMMKIKNIKNR